MEWLAQIFDLLTALPAQLWAALPPVVQFVIVTVLKIVVVLVPLILGVAYFTYWERKILGWIQARIGPNRVGWKGLLQPFVDIYSIADEFCRIIIIIDHFFERIEHAVVHIRRCYGYIPQPGRFEFSFVCFFFSDIEKSCIIKIFPVDGRRYDGTAKAQLFD